MSGYGIITTSRDGAPATAQLHIDGDDLVITRGGETEVVPLLNLYRMSNDAFQLRLGRRGIRSWRLSVDGALADELRYRVGSRRRRINWGAARVWHIALFVGAVLVVELVKVPAEWLAPIVPAAIERRLVPADLRTFGSYCHSREGEQVLRKLIAKLDPELAGSIKTEVLNDGGFVVTSLPGNRLAIFNSFLTSTEGDEFAALLAHEVAHLRNGDPLRAALRANGTLGSLIGTLTETRRPENFLEFSREEERTADARAIQMLRRAGISTLPGASLFARMDEEREANRSFGKEQYYLHYGLYPDRAQLWRDAPDRGELLQAAPALTDAEADALFNYCWRTAGPRRVPLPEMAAGAGK